MSTKSSIYFDYAAATPMSASVVEAMKPFFSEEYYNPSAIYLKAQNVKQKIEAARHSVAQVLGARSEEIIFTAGATESCNLALKGVMDLHPDSNLIISSIEHSAVINAAKNYSLKSCPVNEAGIIDLAKLKKMIDDKTVLISIIHANNEIGVIQRLSDIRQLISATLLDRKNNGNDRPLLLHSDAAQSGNYLDLHVSRLGVDMLTLNGGKMYGPKQSGILYVKSGVKIKPLIDGGGQEWGFRSGTENVPSVIGFAKALEDAQASRKEESSRLSKLQQNLINNLTKAYPNLEVNGSTKHRLPNNVNFSVPNVDGERVVMMLDELGVECATGAACSALSDESSHVIRALGKTENAAKGSIRVSLGRDTTEEEIGQFMTKFKQVMAAQT